ncbi:hypothetical protein LSTR_LSTR001004 [Laodelphax striatellus]|uniref:C2H2-type domain-containing protein n=1 Tax=Laodelphax striatellus TaxID=195883 RepID=A0A482X168_LAOST|nr:hypothetical protein LSTR_LSTR001004 [Laodelphax striatellus]
MKRAGQRLPAFLARELKSLDTSVASPQQCDQCGKGYLQRHNLLRHKKYECGIVDQYNTSFYFQEPADISLNKKQALLKPCHKCGKTMSSSASLSRHKKYCGTPRMLKCDFCEKLCSRIDNLKVHMASCRKKRMDTASEGLMMQHLIGERKCEKCGKEFTKSRNLSRHSQSCGKPAQFTCPVCRKQFTRNDNLKVHIGVMHSGLTFNIQAS